MATLQTLVVALTGDTKDYDSKMDQAEKRGVSLGSNLKMLGGIATKALFFGAIGGAVALTGAMVGGIKAAFDWGQEMDSIGDVLGTTARESAGLAVAIQSVGGDVDLMTKQMTILTRGLLDANGKIGPTGKVLESLGVSFQDANGQILPATEILTKVATIIRDMPDGLQKTALMTDLFGKSGKDLSDVMGALAEDGFQMAMEKADALGLTLSEDVVAASIEVGKSWETVKMAGQGLLVTIGAGLLPVLQPLIDKFVEWIYSVMPAVIAGIQNLIGWAGTNLPIALQFLSNIWTTVLQPAITAVWTWMSTVLMPFLQTTVFPWLQVNIPIALQFLANVWNFVLLPAITAVWNWMSTVLIPFLQNVVFPWLQTNIPVALQFLSNVWEFVLKPAIEAVWNWMSTVLMPFLQNVVFPWLQTNIPAAIQTLSNFWTTVLLPAITAVWNFMTTYIIPIFQTIQGIFEVGLKLAIEGLSLVWTTVLKPALDDVYQFVITYITPALTWLKDNVIGPLATAIGVGLKNAIGWVLTKLQELKDLLDKIKIPDALNPGSPTPFEMGIWGIVDAIGVLNAVSLPVLRANMNRLMGIDAGMDMSAPGSRNSIQNNYSLSVYSNSRTERIIDDFNSMKAWARS